MSFILCSNCFSDQGLRLDAERVEADNSDCQSCGQAAGRKLRKDKAAALAHRFFVWGTLHKCDYGAAPIVQCNEHQATSISTAAWLESWKCRGSTEFSRWAAIRVAQGCE